MHDTPLDIFHSAILIKMGSITPSQLNQEKNKVVFVMGPTGSGKTKLSIDLALKYNGEVVNSDKMQVYKGLDILTNKATDQETRGVPHHLLGHVLDPNEDYDSARFSEEAMEAIDSILSRDRLPIIVGGSNSFLEVLVDDPLYGFREKYDCCFLWINVARPVLCRRVRTRVDEMVEMGMIDELEQFVTPEVNYEVGIWRSIGVPEFDRYLKEKEASEEEKQKLLQEALEEMKENTIELTDRQRGKIERLKYEANWDIHRIEATKVFERSGKEALVVWNEEVLRRCNDIVDEFLNDRPPRRCQPSATADIAAPTRLSAIQMEI